MWLKRKIARKCNDYLYRLTEWDIKNISTAMLHQKTFPQFKNSCQGKEVVVCGAGPTLKKYQPVKDAVHIALNRSFLFDKVSFDYIFAQDYDGIRMVQEELVAYEGNNCIKLLGTQDGGIKEIPESLAIRCNALRFNTDVYIYKNGYRSPFVSDIESRPLGNMPNVGLSVMQFALYMNPKRIYIVGCDMNGGHFANGNHTQEQVREEKKMLEKHWEEEQQKLLNKWKEFKEFARIYYPETELVSINPVGLKGMFKDWYQE